MRVYQHKEWNRDGRTQEGLVRTQSVLSLDDLHAAITANKKLASYVEAIRNEQDKSKRKDMKKRLPAVEVQTVTSGHRRDDCVKDFTHYMTFDFDDDKLNYNEVKRIISNDKTLNPSLVFISPSGFLKFIVRDDTIDSAEKLKYHQRTIWAYLYGRYGYVSDTQCKDLVRLTYLSSDSEAYYDPSATTNIDFRDGDKERADEVETVLEAMCGKSIREDKVHRIALDYTDDGIRSFVLDYAKMCVDKRVSILNTYNDWLAFGCYLRSIYDDDKELLTVWDMCSRYGDGYKSQSLYAKLPYLMRGDPSGVFGFIANRSDEFTRLWLVKKQSEYGIRRKPNFTQLTYEK